MLWRALIACSAALAVGELPCTVRVALTGLPLRVRSSLRLSPERCKDLSARSTGSHILQRLSERHSLGTLTYDGILYNADGVTPLVQPFAPRQSVTIHASAAHDRQQQHQAQCGVQNIDW